MNRTRTIHKRTHTTSRAAMRAKSRRRKKQNKSLLIALLVFTFLFSAFIGTGATASKVADTDIIRVSRGDTLWDIAMQCNTEGDDVRDIMDDIMKLNNMKSAELHVGDVLTIPVY